MGKKKTEKKTDNSAKISQLNSAISELSARKEKLQNAADDVWAVISDFGLIADDDSVITQYKWEDDEWRGNSKEIFNDNIFDYFQGNVVLLYEDMVTSYYNIQAEIGNIADDISDKQAEIDSLED